jgi:hypothetical protein
MAVLEIKANGQHRFRGDDVTAVTLVSDAVGRHEAERIAICTPISILTCQRRAR